MFIVARKYFVQAPLGATSANSGCRPAGAKNSTQPYCYKHFAPPGQAPQNPLAPGFLKDNHPKSKFISLLTRRKLCREIDLARRFDGYGIFAGIESVERAIVMRDDLPGFQQIIVNRRMPVADQSHIETERGSVATGGINTVFSHTTGHDQM